MCLLGVGGQFVGAGSPFLPCELQGSTLYHQTWWQALLLAESSRRTLKIFETFITWEDGEWLCLQVAAKVA